MTRRGFTLLEVLVALGLLAAALAALAQLAGGALRNHEYARELDTAVLLARGRMAALEQRYQDSGFKDSDEEDSGDFADQGSPEVRWKVQLVRPAPELSADELVARLAGQAGAKDAGDLVSRILGQQVPQGTSGSGPTVSAGGPAVALISNLLQVQVKVFGETLKRALREMRLTVSWPSGRETRSFTVTEHLVVLNPRAPGGARGDFPDIPASLVAARAAAAASQPKAQPTPPAGAQK